MKKYKVTQEQIRKLFEFAKAMGNQLDDEKDKTKFQRLQLEYNGLFVAMNILGLSDDCDDYIDNQQTPKK